MNKDVFFSVGSVNKTIAAFDVEPFYDAADLCGYDLFDLALLTIDRFF